MKHEPLVELDFDGILQATQSRVRAFIAAMGIAAHEVDDVAQEVYLEFYRQLDRLPAHVAPEGWLIGVARRMCLNHIRRTARKRRLHREALARILARTKTPLERSAGDAVRQALGECLDRLPDDSRRLVKLRYEQDLPSPEIARTTGSTAQAVRVALHRIRAVLRDCISHRLNRQP